jgi:hypothetical protein
MEAIAREQLEASLKESALSVLNQLVAHKIKGADLLLKGFNTMCDITKETSEWIELLKVLISLLQPMFEVIKEWISSTYSHLLEILEWAKKKYHEIFG